MVVEAMGARSRARGDIPDGANVHETHSQAKWNKNTEISARMFQLMILWVSLGFGPIRTWVSICRLLCILQVLDSTRPATNEGSLDMMDELGAPALSYAGPPRLRKYPLPQILNK